MILSETGGDAVSWSWSGPNGFVSTLKSPTIVAPGANASGNYSVTITNAAGISNAATVAVVIYPKPQVVTADAFICPGENVELNATGGQTCSWLPTSWLNNPVSCSPTATPPTTTTYTVTVTDANACTAVGFSTVTVHQAQGLACNDQVVISLDASGSVTLSPDMILEGSTPDGPFYTVAAFDNQGINLGNIVGCNEIGQNLVVMVTDDCTGNSCWGNLKLEDKIKPTINCPGFKVNCAMTDVSPATLLNTYGLTNAFPTVSDNCSISSLEFHDTWFNLACDQGLDGDDVSGFWQRQWTAKDPSGNTQICFQIIPAQRLHIPDLILPAPIEISCNNPNTAPIITGTPYAIFKGIITPIFPNAGACELSVQYSDQFIDLCDGSKNLVRTWLIFDDCVDNSPDNPKEYKQFIKIIDNQGPAFTCPANLTVSTDPFQCCATVNLPDVILQDNCSRVNNISALITTFDPDSIAPTGHYVVEGTLSDFPGNNYWAPDTLGVMGLSTCLHVGNHTVTYRVQDDCGNLKSCSFILSVADLTPPVAACDEFTQVALTIDGWAEVNASTFDDGSFDLCCLPKFEARRMGTICNDTIQDDFGPTVLFCCADIGDTIPVVLRVLDCHNNQNNCMVQVYVEDKIKPSCVPPAQAKVSCENFDPSLWAYGWPTVADNCCLDTVLASVNYQLFDTICNRGTITRTFRAFDCYGNISQCTQRVVVDYEQDYFLRFPNDVNIKKCDGTGNYGAPLFFQNDCELVGISYEDEIFTVVPDACYQINRRWKVVNWCTYNPQMPCVGIPNPEPSPNPLDPNNIRGPIISPPNTVGAWTSTTVSLVPGGPPVNFSQFYVPNANCYTFTQYIKIADTQDPALNAPNTPQTYCDLTNNDPALWNDTPWLDQATSSHNLCEGPADVVVTTIDSCSGTNIFPRYLLFLDLDNDGDMETVINSNTPQGNGSLFFGNAFNNNFSGGTLRNFDQRNVPVNQKYRFALQTTIENGLVKAAVRWNTQANPTQYTIPELPYGTHKIKWIVEDGCGNETIREYAIIVKDCKKPTVVCLNGISTNNMVNGEITLWVNDFLQYAEDNCTPANFLKMAVRKKDAGTGFPQDANGNPQTSVTFTCDELGQQPVEIWAMDLAGNADFCETYALVQDNDNNCPQNSAKVSGFLATESPDGLEDAQVQLLGVSPSSGGFLFTETTDFKGKFIFNSLPLNSNFSLTPSKDDNPLNGVSTYDLVLISKHILGIAPLASPYRMIAADVNKSGSITNFDIVELRKLILGIYTELPGNTSWRFVNKSFSFPNPFNPFQTTFPETLFASNFPTNTVQPSFVAVKIGDVNLTALPNSFTNTEDRNAAQWTLQTKDQVLASGEETILDFTTQHANAFQFTLEMPGLEILDLMPGTGMRPEHFAVFKTEQRLTCAWDGAEAAQFSVRVRAQKPLRVSESVHISHNITPPVAYRETAELVEKMDVSIQFKQETLQAETPIQVAPAQPNPFSEKTTIRFFLPVQENVRLSVTRADGQLIAEQEVAGVKGWNTIELNAAAWKTSNGWHFCRLETSTGYAIQKLMLIRI